MAIGIRTIFVLAANQSVAASIVPVTATGMTVPIAANQTLVIKSHLTFSVGAAGGVRLLWTVPAGGTLFNNDVNLSNTVAPATVLATQPTAVAFTNALANAGTHFCDMDTVVVNGSTAGSVTLQFAQNTSDATAVIMFRGSKMEVTAV